MRASTAPSPSRAGPWRSFRRPASGWWARWAARRCSRGTEGQKRRSRVLFRRLGSFTRTAGTHAEVRYRCFLPDLAGFTSPRCPDHKLFVTTTTERVGFEPTIPFRVYTRSRRAPSTTRPPLHETLCGERRIRTYDTVPGMPDFESGAFDHSASSPDIHLSRFFSRNRSKKSFSIWRLSSAKSPLITWSRWLCRGSSARL